MAKKAIESSGVGKAIGVLAAKKASVAKKVSAVKGTKFKPVFTPHPVRAKARKVPESEVEKERKAIEARGFKADRVCVTTHGRMPRRLKSEEEPRAILCYMRPDGLFVRAVLGEQEIPPERRAPYGIFKRPQSKEMGKVFDMKAVTR